MKDRISARALALTCLLGFPSSPSVGQTNTDAKNSKLTIGSRMAYFVTNGPAFSPSKAKARQLFDDLSSEFISVNSDFHGGSVNTPDFSNNKQCHAGIVGLTPIYPYISHETSSIRGMVLELKMLVNFSCAGETREIATSRIHQFEEYFERNTPFIKLRSDDGFQNLSFPIHFHLNVTNASYTFRVLEEPHFVTMNYNHMNNRFNQHSDTNGCFLSMYGISPIHAAGAPWTMDGLVICHEEDRELTQDELTDKAKALDELFGTKHFVRPDRIFVFPTPPISIGNGR